MSQYYPDRKVWLARRYTPRVVRSERLIWGRGTRVRRREDPRENARLMWFADLCNGNLARKS
jgi:hypothetical protein